MKATFRKYRTGNESVKISKCQNNVGEMVKKKKKVDSWKSEFCEVIVCV